MPASLITSPTDAALDDLCNALAQRADQLDAGGEWPAEQLRLCGEHGVFQWFIRPEWGGQAWSEEDVLRGYLALSSACLTTTFVLTQRTGACTRLATPARLPSCVINRRTYAARPARPDDVEN